MAIIEHIRVGDLGTNCYIFGDSNTKEVVVVDPGYEGSRIMNVIESNAFTVKYIVLTHGHLDHIGAVQYIKERTSAQVVIHKLDSKMLIDPVQNLSAFVMEHPIVQPEADRIIEGGDVLSIGSGSFKIIHTPGHTMGSICILFDKNLFSGDTLFKETVGRTDLPGSSHSDILRSIKKLIELDEDIKVYPGHGDISSIGHEKIYNPFINEKN